MTFECGLEGGIDLDLVENGKGRAYQTEKRDADKTGAWKKGCDRS